jgi:hypothetical protein
MPKSADLKQDLIHAVSKMIRENNKRIREYTKAGGEDTDYLEGKTRAYQDVLDLLDKS